MPERSSGLKVEKTGSPRSWPSIISSVKTPLGFFVLLALIVDGALAFRQQTPLLVPAALLALLIICVFVIVVFKPLALYHPDDWPAKARPMIVTLLFPIEAIQIDLDENDCIVEIRDQGGKPKQKAHPNLTFGNGGWIIRLTDDLEPSDSVRLELIEHSGKRWRTNPFAPYQTQTQMIQVGTP